ncbi:hypothetical protein Bca52824_018762 [Brassica carinata]|uniref:Uncharacterized protein n=1 Tax=Brassica carinata TaxID=52824 RepID=A0A8X8AXT7_BRACI|nr:hypothetical protein Bca52824_018762 [Brassica carinata]
MSLISSIEYFMNEIANEKTNMVAFGVLPLEIITGRRAIDNTFGKPHTELKSLRLSERHREKDLEKLNKPIIPTWFRCFYAYVEIEDITVCLYTITVLRNLQIKKINEEKAVFKNSSLKSSYAAYYAEATLRRIHAAGKDDDMPPVEAILAPLEAELKLPRSEAFCIAFIRLGNLDSMDWIV